MRRRERKRHDNYVYINKSIESHEKCFTTLTDCANNHLDSKEMDSLLRKESVDSMMTF